MKRVLVTGAAGFIGRHALVPLVARGFEVHAVSRRGGVPTPAGAAVRWHCCDLFAAGELAGLIERAAPTHLLHLAWCTQPGVYWTSTDNLRWVEASLALVRTFRDGGGDRAVIAGTCAEYDWTAGICHEDATPLHPSTLYGTCKNSLNAIVAAFAKLNALSFAWGRIFHLYGPFEHRDRLVPVVIRALIEGRRAEVSSGEQLRDFAHVADVAEAFAELVDSDLQGAVNVAGGIAVAVRDVVGTIARLVGREDLVALGARPPVANDPPVLLADTARLASTGWKPRYGLADGLAQAIEWWRAQPAGQPA